MPIRISIVDDNASFREGLAQILTLSPGIMLVGSCGSAEEALRIIPDSAPDVVLMDINLPGASGVCCVRELKARMPQLQIIMLTINSDRQRVFDSLAAGATGYLVKTVAPAQLLAAIEEVQRGGAPMSSDIARMLVQSFHKPPPESARDTTLSDREMEVLDLVASGKRSREIGDKLGISLHTVNAHLRRVYEKLHVRSRAEAVSKYLKGHGPA
jgi:DNA-binding NarL/FixJ family response regulator